MKVKETALILAALLLALAGRSAAQSYTLPPGAIALWRGEGNAQDAIGANHGTFEPTVTFAPGRIGQAFSFNGLPDGTGIVLGNVPAFDFKPSSSFTMTAWVNSRGNKDSSSDGQTILSLNSQCAATVQILTIGDGERVGFEVRDVNLKGGSIAAPGALSKNTWHHVAGVREVTASGKTVKLYVDGVLVAAAADLSTGELAFNTADRIGWKYRCGMNTPRPQGTVDVFNGLIDEPAVYGRALSEAEIAALIRAGSAPAGQAPGTQRVAIRSVQGFPNERVSSDPPGNAIDGDLNTFTWTTETDNAQSPAYLAVGFESTRASRLRLWKSKAGGGGPDVKNLTIEYTTDSASSMSSRNWTRVTGLRSGVNGAEPFTAASVSADGSVTGDVLDSPQTGRWGSLTFDPITATGLRIGFRNPPGTDWRTYYRVGEIEVYFDSPPSAKSFDFIGNTLLIVDREQGGIATRIQIGAAHGKGVLAGSDPENDRLRVVGCKDAQPDSVNRRFGCHTENGSSVQIFEDGAFVYPPVAGDSRENDSFLYFVYDGASVTAASATLNRHGRVWYVENNYVAAGPGSEPTGLSVYPFLTLANAEQAAQPGDTIYVLKGDGTSKGLDHGVRLKAGQRLIGAGQDLVMPLPSNPRYLVLAATTAPRIENPAGSAVGGSEMPAEIAGLLLQGATDGIGLAAPNGSGTIWIHDNQIRGGSGAGLRVVSAPSAKVKLTGGTIEAHAGQAVDIQGAALEIQGEVTISIAPGEVSKPQ